MQQHIERAWQHLENGEFQAASAIHRQFATDTPEAPAVVALGAALLAAQGKPEAAIAQLMRAVDLVQSGPATAPATGPATGPAKDPATGPATTPTTGPATGPAKDPATGPATETDVVVQYLLDIAELQLYALDDPEAAIDTCQRILDIATEDEELIEAVLLESESYLALGDHDDQVRELLQELDGCSIDDPAILCRAGDQYAIIGDSDDAARCFARAIDIDENCADAHHGLGLVCQTQGRTDEQVRAWLRVRQLDIAGPRPPWQLSEGAIEAIVDGALAELPDEVRALLGNVPIFLEDAPDEPLIREGIDPRLLGLFSGQPLPHQSHIVDGQSPTLERIQLFTRNLERACASPEQFSEELRITVLHETAHFFGLEDNDLDDLGLG